MKRLVVLVLCIGQWACNPGQEPVVESYMISALYSSTQCNPDSAGGIRIFADDTELKTLWHQLHRMQLDRPAAPVVDLRNSNVVLISMGQKPTAGYALQPASSAYVLKNHVAVIQVQWLEPKPGSMQAQVVTNPCLLLQVPKGEYTDIEIVDQHQRVLFRHAV